MIVVNFQVTAHRARDQDREWPTVGGVPTARHQRAPLRLFLLRLSDGGEARVFAVLARESRHQPTDGACVGEIVKMIDLGALVFGVARAIRLALESAHHGPGIDHQIMFCAIEPIRQQHLESLP